MDTVQRGCYRQAYLDDYFPDLSETTVYSDYFEVNEVSFQEMPKIMNYQEAQIVVARWWRRLLAKRAALKEEDAKLLGII